MSVPSEMSNCICGPPIQSFAKKKIGKPTLSQLACQFRTSEKVLAVETQQSATVKIQIINLVGVKLLTNDKVLVSPKFLTSAPMPNGR